MSAATPRGTLEGPVTPATLAALLRDARGYLHDAPRDGQQLGMRIDEALAQWTNYSTWCFPIVCNPVLSDADIAALENTRPGSILTAGKPITFADIPWAGEAPRATFSPCRIVTRAPSTCDFGGLTCLTCKANSNGEEPIECRGSTSISVQLGP